MTPPEDCGGAYGYTQLRKVLKDPTHEEHSIGAEYDFDGGFDLDSVNEVLSEIVFTVQIREEFWDCIIICLSASSLA